MTNDLNLAIVIMAGGGGTRFWPLSSPSRPKQFLSLLSTRTLLQQTYDRIEPLLPRERIVVLTNRVQLETAQKMLPDLPRQNFIAEPQMRDTAAAVTLGAVICRRLFGDCVMAVLPSDHHIPQDDKFRDDLTQAAQGARRHSVLYTFGIRPTYPATSYGYLERGAELEKDKRHYALKRFVEKPDLTKAMEYVNSGNFLWNSGIFVWPSETILAQIKQHLPEHAKQLFPLEQSWLGNNWEKELERAFAATPKISIDFGVMEKAKPVHMLEAGFKWDDVGGWLALEKYLERDNRGNVTRGQLASLRANNNIIFCDDEEEKVALVGVDNMIVVRAGNSTLVVPKDKAEEVKQLVERMNQENK